MSVDDRDAKTPPPKKRHFWRWGLGILLFILLVILILATLLWANRYALMEDFAKNALAERGIEAELSISQVTKTRAVLKDITLSNESETFFSAERVAVDYTWREALKGRLQKLVVTSPKARLAIDETGQIIDGWMPSSSGDGGEIAMPPKGIVIENGEFSISSPYGDLISQMDANILARDNLTAKLDIAPAQFSYQDYRFEGGGTLDIALQGDTPDITLDVHLASFTHPALDATKLSIKGEFIPEIGPDIRAIDGDLDVTFGSFHMAQVEAGAGVASWQGRAALDSRKTHPLSAKGAWQVNAKAVTLPDPARRQDFANKLSLSETLMKTPIAQNFSPEVTRSVTSLLTRSDAEAQGHVELNAAGVALYLDRPATLTSAQTTFTLSPAAQVPLYRFDRAAGEVSLGFDAFLDRPAGLRLRNAEVVAKSDNGYYMEGIEHFEADVSSASTWAVRGIDKRPARLGPFKAAAVYDSRTDIRTLSLIGGLDYDGNLPVGYVTDLVTSGRMDLTIDAPTLSVAFSPKNAEPIRIKRLETATEWRAEDISAKLVSTGTIYESGGGLSKMNARLTDIGFIAIDQPGSRNLGMTFAEMDVAGVLEPDRQNWDMVLGTAKICSEDTPGPGTDIRMPQAHLSVLRQDDGIQFKLDSLKATTKTQLVYANDLAIEVSGTPSHYTMHYRPGADDSRVKFIGDAIPKLPMTGSVTYHNETFTGTARTQLPLTTDTPINIAYRFKNGAGTADVDIPQLVFKPKALQPQYLISALKGKIADVEGMVSAKIKLGFAAGQPVQSSGSVKITDMNFGTLPGPLTGVNTELQFSSMFPLQSEGRQTLTVNNFDPGFPLQNGEIEFALIPDGVKVYAARWPIGDGFFSLDPFDWLYTAPQNKVVMRIENVSISEFLKDIGNGSLKATGNIAGTLPIVLAGIDVQVENGELYVKDGGVIQYQSQQINSVTDFPDTDEKAVKAIREGRYRDATFEALKDFRYKELRAKIDGPLDGAIDVGMIFEGKNNDVLGGQPFLFDISLQGELLNILRSFNTNAQIKSELARRGILDDGP